MAYIFKKGGTILSLPAAAGGEITVRNVPFDAIRIKCEWENTYI
ncbi:hypothetical protein ACIXFK_14350 [Bacteroides fragilis]|jgi:hypothetical protein|uniref:Uncharacterized protein n=1 Tax=Bacteroides fragilis str. 3976T8 TaxID=1339314 RepID=A0A016APC2_BACFG|nr:hypothetical protein [Bacteroides fragilis]EXZ73255.1 hypothetical protein M123_2286 [Bacteroides fragilis str. 3976T8]